MTKHRVLQVIGGGEIGGAENHLLNLMRLMADSNYESVLICLCPGPFADLAGQAGITTYTIPMAHPFDITKIKAVRQIIADEHIKLVHTHGVRANLVARRAAHELDIPVVTTFHSSLKYDYNNRLAAAMAQLVTRLTNIYTTRYIAISGAIKDYMITLGIAEDQIDVIYNGIDLDQYHLHYANSQIRHEIGIPEKAEVIGTVGRLHFVKGHIHLLDAAEILFKNHPNLYLIIVGDGPESTNYPNQIADRGLTGRVIMPGFCPDVFKFYSVMDIFCLPSLMEGQGLVLLEAISMELPVVAACVGGVPEVIQHNYNGLLVPPADAQSLASAIEDILTQPELRTRLVSNSKSTLEQFSLHHMGVQTTAVYDRVLSIKNGA